MSNNYHKKRKKNTYLDKDDVISDYRCRFIQQSKGITENHQETSCSGSSGTLTGENAQTFYETIIGSESSNKSGKKVETGKTSKKVIQTIKEHPKHTFEDIGSIKKFVAKLFSLSGNCNNTNELSDHLTQIRSNSNYNKILNSSDQYGWTAIFCAAAAGNLDAVKLLIKEGANYKDLSDEGGNDIYSVCHKNNAFHIIGYLETLIDHRRSQRKKCKRLQKNASTVVCTVCGVPYEEELRKQHELSMMHLFQDKSKLTPQNVYSIPQHNVGYQMMLRSGWEQDNGLGPDGAGRKNPVKTVLKQDRAGFGLNEQSERVSHFDAFDEKAVARVKSEKKKRNEACSSRKYPKSSKLKSNDANWERDLRRYMSTND